MATEPSKSGVTANSYIGCVISLTTKSEIRYQGVLEHLNVNNDDSSLGLKNVRSFGTEGRKKEGPHVPPNDKLYGYILFRGSDIKDLQVKSFPPTPGTSAINNDPAIIQSHYTCPASTSTSAVSGSGSLTDLSPNTTQVGLPASASSFQGSLPLYQPAGNTGSWGPSAPPIANGGGLGMPMYWQGFYGSPNGLPPQLQQQSLLRPPPGLPLNPIQQQPIQYPSFNASLPTASSNLIGSNILEIPSPLPPPTTSSLNLGIYSFSPSSLPSPLPPAPSVTLASEVLPTLVPNKAPSSLLPPSTLTATFPSPSFFSTPNPDVGSFLPSISNKLNAIPAPTLPFQVLPQSTPSIVGTSSTSFVETLAPSLVTPAQMLPSGSTAGSVSQSLQASKKDVEVVQVPLTSSEQSVPVPKETRPPILPLPVHLPGRADQKLNGASHRTRHIYRERERGGSERNGAAFHTQHTYRGQERGRGSGSSRPVAKFNADFDFTAMNEKFNKDEVWGNLGKSNGSHSRDREDGSLSDIEEVQEDDDAGVPKESKPLYIKDDFFDTLSCNSLDCESRYGGRPRFSEQMKLDTETFGDLTRLRGGHGGQGGRNYHRGGNFGGSGGGVWRGGRGEFYGRNYGYVPRGRGPGGGGGQGRGGRGMPRRTM